MADPSYELSLAMLSRLKGDAEVAALVPPAKIFSDDAPPDAEPDFVVIGDTDAHQENAVCVDGQGIFVTIHIWSWGSGEAKGTVRARKICQAVRTALHDRDLALTTNRLVSVEHRRTQVFKDRDGIKNHGVMEFWASVEAV